MVERTQPGWYRGQDGYGGTKNYGYVGEEADADPLYPDHSSVRSGLKLSVIRQKEEPNFGVNPYDRRYRSRQPAGPDTDESQMFTHIPAEVDSLFSTKDQRARSVIALGLAQQDAYPKGGRMLQYPSDLSPHSARMVHSLERRGVGLSENPENPEAEIRNDYSFPKSLYVPSETPIGAEELAGAKRTVRSILGKGKSAPVTPPAPPQGEQMRLF
jgi:hypothetical protein